MRTGVFNLDDTQGYAWELVCIANMWRQIALLTYITKAMFC